MAKQIENVIETIGLTKVYKDFWGRGRVRALDSLDLTVRRGEVLGLLGPNGSGKTTMVRLLLGLLFPTGGRAFVFGRDPRNIELKKSLGYMPEESNLYSYLNAEETLHFFGRLFGLSRGERTRRVASLIGMVGLERARRRPVGEFSKGMARRIGLAQALINDPDLLILDEPTSGLDPIGTREMKDLITMLRGRGKTILLCSHLLADVEETCDRVCILYGGKARALGDVNELLVRQEMMQIRSPKVSEVVVKQITDLIHADAGAEANIEVGSPAQKLEEFFLDVVKQARRERLVTAGAEAGGPAAEFLTGGTEEAAGDELVQGLVAAGQDAAAQEGAAATEPAPEKPVAMVSGPDTGVLQDLVEGAEEAGRQESQTELELEPVEDTEVGVRHEVLDDLIEDGSEGGDRDDSDTDT